ADGRDHAVMCTPDAFGGEHHLGAARKRVAPERHWHGAGMARRTDDDHAPAALANDTGYDAEWLVRGLQPRALLDMQFNVSGRLVARIGRFRKVGGILAVFPQRVRIGHAVAIRESERLVLEYTRGRRRRRKRGWKARAFLVAERDHVDRHRRTALEVLDRNDSGDDTERSIVIAGIDHAIQVRADQQTPSFTDAATQRAKRVLAHLH